MDNCIPTEIAREFVPVVFLVAPTNEWTLGFHFIRYARLTELALFKPARGSPLGFGPDVGRRQRDPEWSHKLTVRERLISAARWYRFSQAWRRLPSVSIGVDELLFDKIHDESQADRRSTNREKSAWSWAMGKGAF